MGSPINHSSGNTAATDVRTIVVSLSLEHDVLEYYASESSLRNAGVPLRLHALPPRIFLLHLPLCETGKVEALLDLQGMRAEAGPPLYLDQQLRGPE
jgi:hypothetical protein